METDKETLVSIGRALRAIGEALAKGEPIGANAATISVAIRRIAEATGDPDLLADPLSTSAADDRTD